MSNNELAQWVIVFLIGSWIPGLFISRKSRWAFVLWFPLTVVSCLGTLALFFSIAMITQGGWTAVGGLFGALYTFVCPFLLVLNLWYRPQLFDPLVTIPTVGLCIAGAFFFMAAPSRLDKIPVVLHLTTVDGEPVPGAAIKYKTYAKESGFSPALQGEAKTDFEGKAILYTRRLHDLFGYIRKDGFSRCQFQFRSSFRFGYHQIAISWQGAAASPDYQDNQSAMIDVRANDHPELTLYLPRKGFDTWLPYPPYEPTWLPKPK